MMDPKETLSDDDITQGLSFVLRDGLATQAMVTLTSGIFLVAFGLQLGASNTVIGLLAAIPPLAELIQMPAISVVERVRNRRLICVGASIIARLFWIIIALIPFLFGPAAAVPVLIMSLILYGSISAISHCSWNSWMRDLVPQEILGSFFSRRMSLSLALGIVLSLGAGAVIDIIQKNTDFTHFYGIKKNMAFACTTVMTGIVNGVVIATQSGNEVGKINRSVSMTAAKKTLILRMDRFSVQIGIAIFAIEGSLFSRKRCMNLLWGYHGCCDPCPCL